jgi:dienelactone hydrolase
MDVYITSKNSSPDVIVVIYDIFGFDSGRTRQFCDELANQGYSVYMPDLFRGDLFNVDDKTLTYEQFEAFMFKHNLENVKNDIFDNLVPFIKSQQKVNAMGVVGFCWGGIGVL